MYTQLLSELCLCIINIIQKIIFLPMESIEKILKMAEVKDNNAPTDLVSSLQHQ